MKRLLVPLLLLATSGFAQEVKKATRLESFTWNPGTQKLSWVVSEGRVDQNDDFIPEGGRSFYSIDMNAAVMFHEGDGRPFSKDEANVVIAVLNLLSRYALKSVMWWQADESEPVDPKDRADDCFPRSPPQKQASSCCGWGTTTQAALGAKP